MTPEGKVQAAIVSYAEKLGFLVLRFEVMAQSGYPDLMLVGHGKVAFIEVKRKGKKPTSLQAFRLKGIEKRGVRATWFDNINDAEVFINELIGSK